jgi:hypothetical protein
MVSEVQLRYSSQHQTAYVMLWVPRNSPPREPKYHSLSARPELYLRRPTTWLLFLQSEVPGGALRVMPGSSRGSVSRRPTVIGFGPVSLSSLTSEFIPQECFFSCDD